MDIAITATQTGLANLQATRLSYLLMALEAKTLRHGDCIGGDAEANDIGERLCCWIEVHPPIDSKKRAFKQPLLGNINPPEPFIKRNHVMVDRADLIIGLPKIMEPWRQLHSGTWATLQYAVKIGKPILIIAPDGTVFTTIPVSPK